MRSLFDLRASAWSNAVERSTPGVDFAVPAKEKELIRKGTRVKELTKKIGQAPRTGKVVGFHHDSVEVQWDDGHRSSLAGALLVPLEKSKSS